MIKQLLSLSRNTLADFVFPRICCGCNQRIIETGRIVCADCEAGIAALALPLCPRCGTQNATIIDGVRCDDCPRGEISFKAARATTAYAHMAKTLVEKLKYSCREEYAPMMARRMAPVFTAEFAGKGISVIVPVPLYSVRQRERGFNQSQVLAAELSPMIGLPVEPRALRRIRPTKSQTRLSRSERTRNILGAFSPGTAQAGLRGATVLLVDDVCTTCATLNECARTLFEGGADTVYCLVYARTTLREIIS
ncbi:MAG: ComF family protein [bacterium]|nr:ComF family protein [Candidatus Sumerlaeota bacterium]